MVTAARPRIEPIVVSDESTVVGLYEPARSTQSEYQSEAALEDALIVQLRAQAYEYLDIHDLDGLTGNLRKQLELLNDYRFTDDEWARFYEQSIVNVPSDEPNSVIAKARRIHEDYVQVLTRDDGTIKNIRLIDKTNIHRNKLQVIRQFAIDTGERKNRYDVTILVNGLPLIHIELKQSSQRGLQSDRPLSTGFISCCSRRWALRIRADLHYFERCTHQVLLQHGSASASN